MSKTSADLAALARAVLNARDNYSRLLAVDALRRAATPEAILEICDAPKRASEAEIARLKAQEENK